MSDQKPVSPSSLIPGNIYKIERYAQDVSKMNDFTQKAEKVGERELVVKICEENGVVKDKIFLAIPQIPTNKGRVPLICEVANVSSVEEAFQKYDEACFEKVKTINIERSKKEDEKSE